MHPKIQSALAALNTAFPELQPRRRKRSARVVTYKGIRYRVKGQMLVPSE